MVVKDFKYSKYNGSQIIIIIIICYCQFLNCLKEHWDTDVEKNHFKKKCDFSVV